MESMGCLKDQLNFRLNELREMKDRGNRVIGYIPNGYMPEELLRACGALPLALFKGGESFPVAAANECLGRFLDPFSRAQLGYRITREEPFYLMPDLLIVPITDIHTRAIADAWGFYTDTEVLRLTVPHKKSGTGLRYYLKELRLVKESIERFTGEKISEKKIKEQIGYANRIRELFKEISLSRRSKPPLVSGRDFIELCHISYYAETMSLVSILEKFLDEARQRKKNPDEGPRILLSGSTLGWKDLKVIDLIEDTGASVVIEEFSEGIRDYWNPVEIEGDPVEALAECCFMKRNPGAFFRDSSTERFSFLLNLARDFMVHGVVWYSLMYRETYDIEGFLFHRLLNEKYKMPMLNIHSAYDENEAGNLETRIETFIETINISEQFK